MNDEFEEDRNSGGGAKAKQAKSCGCQDDDTTEAMLDEAYEAVSFEADDDNLTETAESSDDLVEHGFDIQTHGGGSLENVPGFEMFEPMLDGIGETGEEPLPEDWESMTDAGSAHYDDRTSIESICGRDDRVRVRAVSSPPWRMIAKLFITLGNGKRVVGTGWFVSPRTLITAGHCVFSSRNGGWARSVTVVPGMNGRKRPFGSARSATFRSVKAWTQHGRPESDVGAIILPKSAPLGQRTGYFGFAALKNSTLKNLLVNTSGYPADKSIGTQWYNGGRITHVRARQLDYMIDTFGGQSGSPVWRYSSKTRTRHVVGIHNYGGCDNKASRVTTGLHRLMQRWKQEGM